MVLKEAMIAKARIQDELRCMKAGSGFLNDVAQRILRVTQRINEGFYADFSTH